MPRPYGEMIVREERDIPGMVKMFSSEAVRRYLFGNPPSEVIVKLNARKAIVSESC